MTNHFPHSRPASSWLTTRQMAERLQVHPGTLVRWARHGVVRAIRLGNRWRFDPGLVAEDLTPSLSR